MLYLYYGDNTYLLEEKLRAFRDRYRTRFPNALNVYELDIAQEGPERLRTIVDTHTLFTETKLVFVRGPSALSAEEDAWVRDLLKKSGVATDKETVLVFYERAPKKKVRSAKKVYAYIERQGTAQEFTAYSGTKLERWVREHAKKQGAAMDAPAARTLITRAGEEMVRLANEIDKLATYSDGGTITTQAIEALTTATVETDVFATIDALADKNTARALALVQDHEEAGDDPFQLLGMFAYELRVLLLINEAVAAGTEDTLKKEHGLHPFVVKKNRARARAFSMGELLSLHDLLAETDKAVKTGGVAPYEGLQDVILGFAGL